MKLEDVAWARPPDPDSAPHSVESIDRVFRAGDVARFVPVDGRQPRRPPAPARACGA